MNHIQREEPYTTTTLFEQSNEGLQALPHSVWQQILILIGLLVAYSLAWSYVTTISGFTNNATDLAEWISIHPTVRGDSLMLTPLLLRLPLVLVVWWFVLAQAGRGASLFTLVVITLLAVALMPPFEFLTSARGDPNYQQQFGLAICAFVGGIAGLFGAARLPKRVRTRLGGLVLLVAILSTVAGTARKLDVMTSMGIDANWGAGAILFTTIGIVGIVLTLRPQKQQDG